MFVVTPRMNAHSMVIKISSQTSKPAFHWVLIYENDVHNKWPSERPDQRPFIHSPLWQARHNQGFLEKQAEEKEDEKHEEVQKKKKHVH